MEGVQSVQSLIGGFEDGMKDVLDTTCGSPDELGSEEKNAAPDGDEVAVANGPSDR